MAMAISQVTILPGLRRVPSERWPDVVDYLNSFQAGTAAAVDPATVAVRIEVTAPVNISPFVARQKVTRFVVQEISSQLRGDWPDLNVGERLCWSVPVVLTSPTRGVVGRVGEILVDAATGELLADAETEQRIAEHAERRAVVHIGDFPGPDEDPAQPIRGRRTVRQTRDERLLD